MPGFLSNPDYRVLKHSLPHIFRKQFKNEEAVLAQAYPLLNLYCKERDEVNRLMACLEMSASPVAKELANQLEALSLKLEDHFHYEALFQYRLPIVLSEFPVHSRAINHAIKNFNAVIEAYHRGEIDSLAETDIEQHYKAILGTIREHGSYCTNESLWQLIGMMAGWSNRSPVEVMKQEIIPPEASSSQDAASSSNQTASPSTDSLNTPVEIPDLPQSVKPTIRNPFIPDYNYNFNGAGRLDTETNFLLDNAFGMKIGGHFDAQVKYPPRFIPLDQLHAIIRRQLSHRMNVWPTELFQLWLETTLHKLGVEFIQKNKNDLSSDILVNPFFKEPISFLSPEKIKTMLNNTLVDFAGEELNPGEPEIEIVSQYLFELLQGFQVNPGLALGIGANWDGTVNLSNEAGAHAFKFRESKADWGRRFKQISLHRQGPSEAKMNAAIGVKFEAQSLFTNFDYMSQLQPSEYKEVIYNALIDNLVTDLFPEPAYFENIQYQKYQKQHVVRTRKDGLIEIDSFLVPGSQGTYFKDRNRNEKQTPMYRRAGTLDVQAFPKNTTYSEQSKVCYAGNPLGPLQMQYAQAMYKNVRGHIVYDPLAADQFLEDSFYGQVILGDNGDVLPFIGVIPKNFDRHFNQQNELCASFVIRMLQSARIMEYCPTFKTTYEQIKSRFLPAQNSQVPALPQFCSDYLVEKHQKLVASLANEDRNFPECQKVFYSLVKNLVYSLYDVGRDDSQFRHGFLTFINSQDTFFPASHPRCEKLIRELTVNRPVNVSPDSLSRYDETLGFLRDITKHFYPEPSETLAQEIARQARLHIQPLFQTNAIKAYFNTQQHNKQENLSRKQTPGMLYAALKHGGPSKTVAKDYRQMHDYNFPSYYRDPDGTPQGEPQTYDRFLDWGAKHLGASLQVMHKYHPFGLLYNPMYQPFIRARQSAAAHQHEPLKPLWALRGAVEGLFWHGIIIGLWQTTTTPFKIIRDFLSWQFANFRKNTIKPIENPLALPAAPANDDNIKTRTSAESRDFLLQLLGKQKPVLTKKNSVLSYTEGLINRLYPYITLEELAVCRQKLLADFPLNEEDWSKLFEPLLNASTHHDLSALLQRHNAVINNNLLQAVFRCVTHPLLSTQPKTIIKQTQSFFSLNSKQNEVVQSIVTLYRQTPLDNKQSFITLFKFNGVLHKALQKRDQFIQNIQNYILKVFDEQWILNLICDHNIDLLISNVTALTMEATIARLPDKLKWPLHLLLTSNNPDVLAEYNINDKQIDLLIKILVLYNLIPDQEQREQMVTLCRVENKSNEQTVSTKDKAHNKWAQFAERELKHQLLAEKEVKNIIAILSRLDRPITGLKLLIDTLQSSYHALDTNEGLLLFYETACTIKNRLSQYIKLNYKNDTSGLEAQTLLKNFLNITMNAVINSRLDNADIFNITPPQNPLLSCTAIELWLSGLQKNNRNLRSLLEQQVQQAPSLDQTIWRCKCILQVMEQQKPTEKIAKTGMQSLLRFWGKHKINVTISGEEYINSETGETKKSTSPVLFDNSVTMQHALTRVHEKQSRISIFNLPPLIEHDDVDDDALEMHL